MAKMRTIEAAIAELRKGDPACALTKTALRRMVLSRQIPYVTVGSKYLVNLDVLEDYLENPEKYPAPASSPGIIRPVSANVPFRQ